MTRRRHASDGPGRAAGAFIALTIGLALALALAIAPAPASAKGVTGTWAGDLTHPEPAEDPFVSSIVITVGKRGGARRVTGVVATVRTYCVDGVRDIRIVKASFNGPRLGAGNAFEVSTGGATITGSVGKRRARGGASGSLRGCTMSGARWEAQRRQFR